MKLITFPENNYFSGPDENNNIIIHNNYDVSFHNSQQFPVIEEERTHERYPLLLETSKRHDYVAPLPEVLEEEPKPGISWISVAFGLANASIGVGILNYPFLYNRIGGWEWATVVQLALLACLFISMSIIIYCSDIHGSCSYHEVMSSMCGPKFKSLVAADIALATYGICIAYLVIIGDQYDRMFASLIGKDFCKHWFLDRKFMIAATSLLMYPVCLLKRLDFLRHTGPLGIFAMLYVVFLAGYEHWNHVPETNVQAVSTTTATPKSSEEGLFSIMSCIPVMLFGYQCNEVIVPIYASLRDRRMANFLKAAFTSYAILLLLYCTVGTLGFLTYGEGVAQNVMLMFNAKDPLVLLGIFAIIFKMVVTYPQMAFAGREAYSDITKEFSDLPDEMYEEQEGGRRFRVSTVWFISSVVISTVAPHIGIVLELMGTLASFNVFICPALCLIFLTRRKDRQYSFRSKFLMIISAIVLMCVGIFFLTFVLVQVYYDVRAAIEAGSSSICVL
jgi:sodium-coupled neutral amino acid transporter 7/8